MFDISHARLACESLNIKYDDYLNQLDNTEKVKILHSTGNIRTTEKNKHIIDKHVLITEDEIRDIIKALNKFTNLDLFVSEFTDDTEFSGVKETIIEAVVLHYVVKTKDEEKCKKILKFLEDGLKDDISNADEILKKVSHMDFN